MASGTKLVYKVGTTGGKKTYTFNRAKSTGNVAANVKALAQGIITYGTFFQPQPITVNSAKLVVTTETNINIS